MAVDVQKVEDGIRVMFDLSGDPRDLRAEAEKVLAAAQSGESRLALVQRLAQLQIKLSGSMVGADCEKLADELIRYVPCT